MGNYRIRVSGLQVLTGITARKDHIQVLKDLNLISRWGRMVIAMTGRWYVWKRCVKACRIIQQCINNMPAGHYKSDHPLAIPPRKEKTMTDIETLITHFVGVSWGPVIPAGEAMVPIEAAKGSNGYYLISDGSTSSYRSRIRTPSFPHMQMLPFISKGYTIPDLLAILGAMDFVLADLDR